MFIFFYNKNSSPSYIPSRCWNSVYRIGIVSVACLRTHHGSTWASSAVRTKSSFPVYHARPSPAGYGPETRLCSYFAPWPLWTFWAPSQGIIIDGSWLQTGSRCHIFAGADLSLQDLLAPSVYLAILGSWKSLFHASFAVLPGWPVSQSHLYLLCQAQHTQ